MRSSLLISLIVIHLLGNTELGELLKLPRLIAHYIQHHSENPAIGFLDFVSMHYISGNDGSTADDWQDQQLPCHNAKQQHSFSQILTPEIKTNDISIDPLTQQKVLGGNLQQWFSAGFVSLIIQPPRA